MYEACKICLKRKKVFWEGPDWKRNSWLAWQNVFTYLFTYVNIFKIDLFTRFHFIWRLWFHQKGLTKCLISRKIWVAIKFPKCSNCQITFCEIQNFAATRILREITFVDLRFSKTAVIKYQNGISRKIWVTVYLFKHDFSVTQILR